jgi:hypothetical protein
VASSFETYLGQNSLQCTSLCALLVQQENSTHLDSRDISPASILSLKDGAAESASSPAERKTTNPLKTKVSKRKPFKKSFL